MVLSFATLDVTTKLPFRLPLVNIPFPGDIVIWYVLKGTTKLKFTVIELFDVNDISG